MDGSLHAPGYNMAVIDAKTGRLLEKATFDLTETGSEQEAADMVAWMGAIPQGSIVAVALQGCQTPYMITEVAEAFLTIGAYGHGRAPNGRLLARRHRRQGCCLGTALEAYSGPGSSWLRAAPDWRTLAMAVD